MDAILEQFLSEARDNLDYLDSHLKELDGGDEETINSLFRAAHTLKGGAGLVGLTHIKEITHAAEDLLDAYRNKKIEYSDKMLDTLYDAFDEVIELIDAVEESGEIDIEVDEEYLTQIKKEIRSFLDVEEKEEKIELPFRVDENIFVEWNASQLKDILPLVQKEVKFDTNYWVIDLNLSVETIENGNDPFYLLSLIDTVKVVTEIYNPDDFSNLLAYKTRMKIVVNATVEEIEDVFYNVIDEISAYPLTTKIILNTDKESIKNETFTQLIEDIKKDGTKNITQKLKTAINVINPDTKEGFLVNRLLLIAQNDNIEKYLEILGIKQQTKTNQNIQIDDKTKQSTLNILQAQKLALQNPDAFERVRFLLKSVVQFVGIDKVRLNDVENVEELNNLIDEMIAKLSGGGATLKEEKSPKTKKQPDTSQPQKSKKEHHSIPKTIKVEQDEIDSLMDIVGEILVIKNSLPYIANTISQNPLLAKRELLGKYEEISRITSMLQDRVMDMRLLPLSYIFNRYPKLVRDISKKLNKKIDYQEYGADVKLDKMMIEKLADPLIHIIRNSLDHGLEEVEDRIKSNKSETGILKIGAKSQGDRVFIEISDDGRGIDVDKVVHKALEKHLIDPDKLDSMNEEEKLKLIFLPGLSTKDEITELSGRGVGADAVKTTVEELGGKIKISSQKNKGTTIVLELPVSVALSNLFQIKMHNENYAIAMDSVIETDKITKNDIQTANHKPFIRLRENIIPLILNIDLLKRDYFKNEENIIIVKVQNTQIALVADELVGQIDVVQKPLTGILQNHPYINGTSLLGNGEPLFIIKPEGFLKMTK